nr:thioesterase family protein [Limosilactobacillus fermentum]
MTKVAFPAAGTVYTHTVQYYETDRMGITHHSNYVRWMEEARTHFLAAIGWDYAKIEAAGIISPVVSVNCRYKRSTTFSDQVVITTKIAALDRVRLTLSYRMECHDQLVCEGTSEHCFTNQDGKLLRLNRDLPDFYQALQEASQVK